MNSPKITKKITYNNLNLELFSFAVIRNILGRSLNTCLRLERLGALPKPMFVGNVVKKGNPVRYYTSHQLFELQKLKYEMGLPGEFLVRKGRYKFWEVLKERWDYLYSCYEAGIQPDSPILLEFKNQAELRNYLMGALKKMGVQSTAVLDEFQQQLLGFRKVG